jgi:hypothetical protein
MAGQSSTGMLLAGAAFLIATPALGAPVAISGASPYSATCGTTNQPGVLYKNAEVEPWVAIDPRTRNSADTSQKLIAVWQQDRWSNGGSRGIQSAYSTDGGATWTPVILPGLTLCTEGPWERASDPWVTFSPDGTAYAMSLALQINPPPNRPGGNGPSAMVVHRSTNGGQTWTGPITLAENDIPRALHDKNSMTADPNDSHYVYAVWDKLTTPTGVTINPEQVFGFGFKGPVTFTRTTNGGTSWEPVRFLYDPGANNQTIGNQVVVRPASTGGRIIDFFNEIDNFKNSDGGTHFDFNLGYIYSDDRGATWKPNGKPPRVQKLQSMVLFRTFGILTPDLHRGVRTGDILFDVAVDSNNGNLYAVWQDARFSNFSIDEIAFSMSVNGGQTWSTPVRINKTPAGLGDRGQAFNPSVEVRGDGSVVVTYYDFRNDNLTGEFADYWSVKCSTNCASAASWGQELRLTAASFDILNAPVARGLFLGDYEGLAADNDSGLAVFSQAVSPSDPTSIFFNRF